MGLHLGPNQIIQNNLLSIFLITSTKTLFPNKVYSEVQGIRTWVSLFLWEGGGLPFSLLWEAKEKDLFCFFRKCIIFPKVRSLVNGVNQWSVPPVITNHFFPKVVFNLFTSFEKIQVVHNTFSDRMPCHQLCQLAVGYRLEGENASNK